MQQPIASNLSKVQTKPKKSTANCLISKQDQDFNNCSYSFRTQNKNEEQNSLQYRSIEPIQHKKDRQGGQRREIFMQQQMVEGLSQCFVTVHCQEKKISKNLKTCQYHSFQSQNCQQCRIDHEIDVIPEMTSYQDNQYKPQIQNLPRLVNPNSDQKVATATEQFLNYTKDFPSSVKQPQDRKTLRLLKTVSISFKPEQFTSHNFRYRRPNEVTFSKFRRHTLEFEQSNSINSQTLVDELKGLSTNSSTKQMNFIKINELNDFIKRTHTEKQMLTLSVAANQKLRNQYRNIKNQMKSEILKLKKEIDQLGSKLQMLKRELQLQKSAKLQLTQELAILNKRFKNISQINQNLLNQNNALKEKWSQNQKTIQELRRDIAKKTKMNDLIEVKEQLNSPKISHKLTQNVLKPVLKPTISSISQILPIKQSENKGESKNAGLEVQENYFQDYFHLFRKQSKTLANFRSQNIISKVFEPPATQRDVPSRQPSVKSQRTVGIRKNHLKTEQNLSLQKNLVKNSLDSNFQDNSSPNNERKNGRQSKSASNYSSLSGSLYQKVGYVQKPKNQAKRGMLVDYMLEDIQGSKVHNNHVNKAIKPQKLTNAHSSKEGYSQRFRANYAK